jgi:hypothetical protein
LEWWMNKLLARVVQKVHSFPAFHPTYAGMWLDIFEARRSFSSGEWPTRC